MNEEQLQEKAAELAATILRDHAVLSKKLEERLHQSEQDMFQRSVQRADEARAKLNREHEESETKRQNQIRELCNKETELRVEEARRALLEVGQAERKKLRQDRMDSLADRVGEERNGLRQSIAGLEAPLVA